MYQWLELASYLKLPLRHVMKETPNSHLLLWQLFREKQEKDKILAFNREDYLFARVAYEVAYLHHTVGNLGKKRPPKFTKKLDDFLVKFKVETQEAEPAKPKDVRAARKRAAMLRKRQLFQWLGMDSRILDREERQQ